MSRRGENVVGVLLAGGLGSRLRPVIGERQKVMADIGGKPFLTRLLERMGEAGIEKAILCVGYKAEEVRRTLGDEVGGVRLVYSVETSPMGTGGATRLAAELADTERLLAMNGDSFVDIDIGGFLRWAADKPAVLALVEVEDVARYGSVDVETDARIVSFREKGAFSGPGLINAGVYALSRELVLAEVSAGRPASLERELFPALAAAGRLYGVKTAGRFIDIGTPESFEAAAVFFATPERRA